MTMDAALAAVAAWMLTYLLHSTIFIVAAILLARRLGDRPELMSGIWKVALVGGVLTATLQVGSGVAPIAGRVALVQAPVRTLDVDVEADVEGTTLAAVDDLHADVAPAIDPLVLPPEEIGAVAAIEPASLLAVQPHPATASAPPWWSVALAIAGLLGAALGLLSVAFAVRALRRRLADRVPLQDGALLGIFRELLVRTGFRRRVGLSVSRCTTVPLAMGIAQPEIVLPQRATVGLAAGQQHTMLAHELAHVFRHDPAWRMVALLAERVFFFQPLNRLAAARMTECAEYLCDDWAARHTDERLALAQCLTEVASWVGASPVVLASAMAGSSSQLRHRVLRLLAPARPTPGRKGMGIVAALAIAAVAWLAPGVSSGDPARVVGSIPRVADLVPTHAHDSEAVRVWTSSDGAKVVIIGADEGAEEGEAIHESAGEPATPPADPKAARRAKRRAAKANREADRALDKAMRKARKEGRAAPADEEIERILSQARKQAGEREPGPRVSVRVEVSEGGARIELGDGAHARVVTVDELAHAQVARARAHGHKAAKEAMKRARKASKRAHHDMEHARRRLQHELRSQDLPPEARRAIERALRRFDRYDEVWITAPPAPPAPPAPFAAHAPPAPPSPFAAEAPLAAEAPPAPPSPPRMRNAPSAPRAPRARSPRGFAPPASPRARGRAPVAPAPPSPPHDIQSIVWTY